MNRNLASLPPELWVVLGMLSGAAIALIWITVELILL